MMYFACFTIFKLVYNTQGKINKHDYYVVYKLNESNWKLIKFYRVVTNGWV